MIPPLHIDFLTTAFTVVAMLALGLLVFLKGERNFSSSIFLFFTTVNALWGTLNYMTYQLNDPQLTLWTIRGAMLLAVFQVFSFFLLVYNFPKSTALPKKITAVLYLLVAAVALFTLTPFVFSGIEFASGGVSQPTPAPGIALFGIFAISFVVSGICILIRKIRRATGLERRQLTYLLFGAATMFILIIMFNFLIPVIFQNVLFVPISGVFVLPFIVATTYSIFKHHLFNIRAIATEIFTTAIILLVFVNTLLSRTPHELIINDTFLILVTVFGIFLIRGTLREIRELERLSRAKSEFVSIASHQLRTPLTAIKGFVSMIEEGSGTEEDRKDWIKKVGVSNERLVRLVDDLLNISRIERGTMQYDFQETDMVQLVENVISDFQIQAKAKNLSLAWEKPGENIPKLSIDSDKMRQVITNLIDNALKYTEKGSVVVRLLYLRDLSKVRLVIQDTGMGIPKEELPNLFELFSRGEGGQKTSSEGVGIGLYVARKIVEAHHGKIWAESDGLHKGSRFIVELRVG